MKTTAAKIILKQKGINMKTHLECLACFVDQALRVGKLASEDKAKTRKLVNEIGKDLETLDFELPPCQHSQKLYKRVGEITGNGDPYKQIKAENIKAALEIFPTLKRIYDTSKDKLDSAIRIAIAGNIIDFALEASFDLKRDFERVINQDFAIYDFEEFKKAASKAKTLLYIADNAGETVFDRILIKHLNKKTYYAVKSAPVLNDATKADTIESGLSDLCEIIESGSEAPGTILSLCKKEFLQLFEDVDMVISKGQGNYVGLSNSNRQIFFLLKAKCSVVAKDLGVDVGEIILKTNKRFS